MRSFLGCGQNQRQSYSSKCAALPAPCPASTQAPRIQKAVYWLSTAASNSAAPAQVIDIALKDVGMKGEPAALTKQALLRNLDIASKLGCLDAEGLQEMRHGKATTVRRGPYAGDQLSVDHIIPRAVF